MTSFVGRRHEVAEVKRLLSGSPVVTLVGVGGVGKSRLAVRVAGEVRRAFPDGVWLVELAALENAELLPQAVAEALELRERSSRPPVDAVTDHLRDKRALVVMDNCEHLLSDCAMLSERLVRVSPDLRILATSRQALGIAGERTMSVPTLLLPAASPAPDALEQSDAVRLFVDRAAAVVPNFSVDHDNRDTIEQICRRLDGIPLAIELAAVRLRALSLQQLLERLNDRFRLLTAGSRALLPRQQTLRALIDWSYTLCTEQERLLWARLSVFAGGLDLETAEEVCAGDGIAQEDVVDLVIGLVDKSVLVREEHSGAVRYRLLETIRQYGRDRLRESGKEHELLRRHCGWFATLAVNAEKAWFGPDQVAWFTRLHLEHSNLRTALDFCLAQPGETESGLDIATSLRFYWIASGSLHEGRRWLDRLLTADLVPSRRRGLGLSVNARLAVLQSDFTAAKSMLDESRELALRIGDREILGKIAYVSGLAALFQENLQAAVASLEEAIERQREIDDQMGVVNSLLYLATAYSFLGDSSRASELFQECLEICEPRREHWFRSYALWVFGIEVWQRGDVTGAIEMERESIQLKRPFNDRLGIALCAEVMAWIAAANGDCERAARLLGALCDVWGAVGGPLFTCLSRYHDECEAETKKVLGPKKFEAAFRKGEQLTFDETITLALADRVPAEERQQDDGLARESPLTRREMEIARLVAQGMSNKEIAVSLVIAQRTAEGHVEHILSKLGFTSRAQIAVWVGERERAAMPD